MVRKSELHELLWPGSFVSDATLTGLVKELRRVLGDHDRRSPLIRTSHGVGYAFSAELESVRPRSPARSPRSIAVLPFANLSPDRDNEYLSAGLTEELINALTHLTGLRVASRTSVFQFHLENADVRDIGRHLNVEHVLEGSIRQADRTLRITTQLVSVGDGCHLWSARYDRERVDVFAMYDEIAAAIVQAIEPALVRSTQSAICTDAERAAGHVTDT